MGNSILELLSAEEQKCRSMLHLTSYENRMSKTAEAFLSSDLGNRYHLSTPDTHNGLDPSVHIAGFSCRALSAVHRLELSAIASAKKMFNAAHIEMRLVSGVHATISTIASMTKPGDIVYSIAPEDGGHFATKHVAESLGRKSRYLSWDSERLNVDLEESKALFAMFPPAMVFLDHGTPLFNLPVGELRDLIPSDSLLVYDASHTLGLIAGGYFQHPLCEGADILQGNTHKTFPGPQKAMVMFSSPELGSRYSKSVSLGLVSSQHTHHSIALGVTILEMEAFGAKYAQCMLENAQVLGNALIAEGLGLVSHSGKFTTSHELLINSGWPDGYLSAVDRLFDANISVNGRVAFRRPTIRLGVQEITRRGMGPDEMLVIAKLIAAAVQETDSAESIRLRVDQLNRDFPSTLYSFDHACSVDSGEELQNAYS